MHAKIALLLLFGLTMSCGELQGSAPLDQTPHPIHLSFDRTADGTATASLLLLKGGGPIMVEPDAYFDHDCARNLTLSARTAKPSAQNIEASIRGNGDLLLVPKSLGHGRLRVSFDILSSEALEGAPERPQCDTLPEETLELDIEVQIERFDHIKVYDHLRQEVTEDRPLHVLQNSAPQLRYQIFSATGDNLTYAQNHTHRDFSTLRSTSTTLELGLMDTLGTFTYTSDRGHTFAVQVHDPKGLRELHVTPAYTVRGFNRAFEDPTQSQDLEPIHVFLTQASHEDTPTLTSIANVLELTFTSMTPETCTVDRSMNVPGSNLELWNVPTPWRRLPWLGVLLPRKEGLCEYRVAWGGASTTQVITLLRAQD